METKAKSNPVISFFKWIFEKLSNSAVFSILTTNYSSTIVDDYLENHRGVKISSDEIWRSIHDTYLAGYEEDFSDADAEEIVGDVVRRLHNDYLKTHTSSSSHKTWSAI